MNFSNAYTFSVDSVVFDFSDSEVTQQDKDTAQSAVVGKSFGVMDESQVIDFISDFTGWCVDSISYHQVTA